MCDKCKCITLLDREHLETTELRRYVIKVLTLNKRSLTPPEILSQIRKIRPINKVTLYRILDLLEQKEIIRKILTHGEVSRYELIDPRAEGVKNLRPYFICRICKTVTPIDSIDVCSLIAAKTGNQFSGPFELTVEGICARCKKEGKFRA